MIHKKIFLLPGDGIGSEIMEEARKILEFLHGRLSIDFSFEEGLIGGTAYDQMGDPLPEVTLSKALQCDAVLMGSVGGTKWDTIDFDKRPEMGLLRIRKEMQLFANLRPAIVFDELIKASSLKESFIKGLDILIVRELIGGIYFGKPAGIKIVNEERHGYNTLVYSETEIERIATVAFELAMTRQKKVCSVDKANVLESMVLWREIVSSTHKKYPHVELSHMYVDNAAMQIVREPKQFDIILTGNMFGDILSDCAAMLTGSLGMLPSASLGQGYAQEKGKALYEPVHGSAPDIEGQDKANPLGQILSLAMMLHYSFGLKDDAQKIHHAVKNTLAKGLRTRDIMDDAFCVGTKEMGENVLLELSKLYP